MIDDNATFDTPPPSDAADREPADGRAAEDFTNSYLAGLRARFGPFKPAPPTRSPMDEMRWFNTPTINFVQMPSVSDVLVLSANPQRVGIIFSLCTGDPQITEAITPVDSAQPFTFTWENGQFNITGTLSGGTFTGSTNDGQGDGSGVLNLTSFNVLGRITAGAILLAPVQGSVLGPRLNTFLKGMLVNVFSPNLVILQKDYGPLCQMGWQASSVTSGGQSLSIVEITLKDWPNPCGD